MLIKHLFQHVSTNVLRRMGRKVKYDRQALERTISLIQQTKIGVTECGVPISPFSDVSSGYNGVTIRTTLMVHTLCMYLC
jgi:hypothetical protein